MGPICGPVVSGLTEKAQAHLILIKERSRGTFTLIRNGAYMVCMGTLTIFAREWQGWPTLNK